MFLFLSISPRQGREPCANRVAPAAMSGPSCGAALQDADGNQPAVIHPFLHLAPRMKEKKRILFFSYLLVKIQGFSFFFITCRCAHIRTSP